MAWDSEPNMLPHGLRLPLIREVESAAALLSAGVHLVMGPPVEPSPVFATLATGAEKLLKLNIGLLALEEAGEWPSVATMKDTYRHEISKMFVAAINDLKRRLSADETGGTARKATRVLLQEVLDDTTVPLVVRCLDEYAKQGRFHNLDLLAGATKLDPSPYERWQELELLILNADPTLKASLGSGAYDTIGQPGLNLAIGSSLVRWWRLHQRAWNTGVIGRQAQIWSAHLLADVPDEVGGL